jgi:hypothetical protein
MFTKPEDRTHRGCSRSGPLYPFSQDAPGQCGPALSKIADRHPPKTQALVILSRSFIRFSRCSGCGNSCAFSDKLCGDKSSGTYRVGETQQNGRLHAGHLQDKPIHDGNRQPKVLITRKRRSHGCRGGRNQIEWRRGCDPFRWKDS